MLEELTVGPAPGVSLGARAVTPVVRHAARMLLKWEPAGAIIVDLPTGHRIRFGHSAGEKAAHVKLRNYRVLWQALRRASLGFAEAYMDGDIECDDLDTLFHFFLRNRDRLRNSGRMLFRVRVGDRLAHLLRRNSVRGSRRNISEHYDLGNDFYRPWLDTAMNYSSGLYTRGASDLEEAQTAKLEAVLGMLALQGGESILEIGCGWGAFARMAASRHGAKVTGITLSHEQLAFAQERSEEAGLQDRCAFQLRDYRAVSETFDRIVSIEMIEAVGEEHWPRYFQTLHDCLKPGGCAVIQAITISGDVFPRYRRKADFIQRYIFPGGMLPTHGGIAKHAREAGLELVSSRVFGRCYARTLGEWRERFEAAWPEIAKLGFDERFRRKWLYYLSYCKAGFEDGVIDVGLYRLKRG